MWSRIVITVVFLLFCAGCSSPAKKQVAYPKKPADTSSRKAGLAMYLYEQAEEDLDVNNSVIVTPPDQVKKKDK